MHLDNKQTLAFTICRYVNTKKIKLMHQMPKKSPNIFVLCTAVVTIIFQFCLAYLTSLSRHFEKNKNYSKVP